MKTAASIPRCPEVYEGTLAHLFRDYAVSVLPASTDVEYLHALIVEECSKPDPLFFVRHVQGTERGRLYTTASGEQFIPSDNAPAWWMHYQAFTSGRPANFIEMPTHMFEVAGRIPTNVNAAGWHVAHIYNAKDRNTDWRNWTKADLTRRFIRNVHPCNCFYVPKPGWQRYGGDPQVIAFFAGEYAKRYGYLWEEFRHLAGGEQLPEVDGESVSYTYPATRATKSGSPSSEGVAVSYPLSRLGFKAALIEPLAWDDVFEVVTPVGTFRMSKAEFYRDFPGVVKTASYRERGVYHYPQLPAAALRFRVTPRSESGS